MIAVDWQTGAPSSGAASSLLRWAIAQMRSVYSNETAEIVHRRKKAVRTRGSHCPITHSDGVTLERETSSKLNITALIRLRGSAAGVAARSSTYHVEIAVRCSAVGEAGVLGGSSLDVVVVVVQDVVELTAELYRVPVCFAQVNVLVHAQVERSVVGRIPLVPVDAGVLITAEHIREVRVALRVGEGVRCCNWNRKIIEGSSPGGSADLAVEAEASRRNHTRAAVRRIGAVVHRVRRTRAKRCDRSKLEAANNSMSNTVLAELEERRLVHAANRKALARVEIRVAVIQPRIERVQVAEVLVVAGLRERSAQVIQRMRDGVVGGQLQTVTLKVVRVEANIHSVVVRGTVSFTDINRAVLMVDTVGRVASRISDEGAVSDAVDVRDGVQMHTMRARVLDRYEIVRKYLMLDTKRVLVGIRRGHVLLERAQGGRRQPDRTRRSGENTEVAGGKLILRCLGGSQSHASIVGRILNYVIGNVAEVSLVADTVATANRPLTVTEHVVSEAHARSVVVEVLLDQTANRRVGCCCNLPGRDLLHQVRARTQEEVRLQVGIVVVLDTVVLPADAVVKGKTRIELPRILNIPGGVVEGVLPGKAR